MKLAGRRVVVVGLGGFGGGAGVARFCVEQGAQVTVVDREPEHKLARGLAMVHDLPIAFKLGGYDASDLLQAEVLVVNPAVSPNDPLVTQAVKAGVEVTSEIRLLVERLPNRQRTIGITGSAGKSTTTAMTGHAMAKILGANRVHVGGNLGGSLLGKLKDITPDDWVVLELSSFMLYGLDSDKWSPHIAAITGLAPNHLDWHGTAEHYQQSKQVIFDHQNPQSDIAILWPNGLAWFTPQVQEVHLVDPVRPWPGTLAIPGAHNLANAWMAATILHAAAHIPHEATAKALEDFHGLSHRLEFVGEYRQVRCYNDSKATTPEAALLAMASFPPGKVHVILGGYDKQVDLSLMAKQAARVCAGVYTIGKTGEVIAKTARDEPACRAAVYACQTLEVAVKQAVDQAQPGEVILLSPGCASWDQFTNFEARGQQFTELVKARLTLPPLGLR